MTRKETSRIIYNTLTDFFPDSLAYTRHTAAESAASRLDIYMPLAIPVSLPKPEMGAFAQDDLLGD